MRGRMVEMLRRRLLSAVSVGVVSSNPAVTVFHKWATRELKGSLIAKLLSKRHAEPRQGSGTCLVQSKAVN